MSEIVSRYASRFSQASFDYPPSQGATCLTLLIAWAVPIERDEHPIVRRRPAAAEKRSSSGEPRTRPSVALHRL